MKKNLCLFMVFTVFIHFLVLSQGIDKKISDSPETDSSKEMIMEEAWKKDDAIYLNFLGKDINARDEYKDQTALHWASNWGKYNIVKALIEKGAKVNIKDYIDETPLHKVSGMRAVTQEDKQAHYKTARLLIEHGAKVNARGGRKATAADNLFKIGPKLNRTPLHLACNNGGNLEIVKLLVEHGADVNAKDYENFIPLQMAIQNSLTKIAEILITYGSSVNTIDSERGHSPLLDSIYYKQFGLVPLLLEKGAKVNIIDKLKVGTPLHLAVHWKNKETVILLLSHSADLTVKNKDGLTPLELAKKKGDKEIIELLEKAESQAQGKK